MVDDAQDRYWMPSTKAQTGKPPATISQARKDRPNRKDWISSRASLVFAAYRKDDFADPQTFLLQLGMVLERYDDKVIETVTHPVTGIQRECKFPPTIAEMTAFIEEHIRRSTYAAQYDARSREQLKERDAFYDEGKPEPLEHRTRIAEHIKNELRAKGFKFAGDEKINHSETPATVMAKHNLTQEQWDAIPDAPKRPDYWQGVRWP